MAEMAKDTFLHDYDEAVKTVRLLNSPRPGGKSKDWLDGQMIGIEQGLKIGRSIVEELLNQES